MAFKAASSGSPPDTTPPTIPTNLTATAISSSQINLSWTASTDDVAVTGYTVFRNGAQVATSATNSFSDVGLSASTTYIYTVSAYDAAGNHSAQSASASATTQAAGTGPSVQRGGGGRYLVDGNNNSFYLVGDTAHSLMGTLTLTDVATYFADRQKNHFNSVAIYAPCGPNINNCHANASTVDGIVPFTSGTSPSSFDLSTPNASYFSRVDAVVNSAASYGLIVLLDPIETGDFLVTLRNNGATKAYNYGVYIGNRYKSFSNIIWQHGEDFQTWQTASDSNLVAQVMAGIASVDSRHLQTVELSYNTSYSNQDATLVPYLTYDMAYTYAETYDMVLGAYNSAPTTPAFLGEANYEGANNTGGLPGPAGNFVLREQEYWTLTAGGTGGQYYGNKIVHHFDPGWQNNLDTSGVIQLGYLENLLNTVKWWQLVPDQSHTIVTAGYGTYNASNLNLTTATYATTSWIPDGSFSISYTPAATTLTVNMAKFSNTVNAKWFDPSAGTYLTVSGSPFANSGTRQFATPGTNRDGNSDWVLLLQSTGGSGPDTTPPSTPTGLTATALSSNQIKLTWTASTDPDSPVAGYDIYRNGSKIGISSVASYQDTGLTPATTYSYTINAYDPSGNISTMSSAASATTLSGSPPSSVISLIQHSGTDCGTAISCTLNFPKNTSAGNFIVLALRVGHALGPVAISDSLGNSYVLAVTQTNPNDVHQLYIYYAQNIAGGYDTVTVRVNAVNPILRMALVEYAGVASSNALDQTASTTGSGTAVFSGSAATTQPNELVFGVGTNANGVSWAAGNGFTLYDTPANKLVDEAMIAANPGSVSATFTMGAADYWTAAVATFRRGP